MDTTDASGIYQPTSDASGYVDLVKGAEDDLTVAYMAGVERGKDQAAALIASQARRIEELEKGAEQARLFIASEYQDPAMEEFGEWLPPEAREVHNALVSLLNRTGEG